MGLHDESTAHGSNIQSSCPLQSPERTLLLPLPEEKDALQSPPVFLGLLVSNNTLAVMRSLWADQVAGFGVVARLEAVLAELKLTMEAPCHRGGEDTGRGDAMRTGSVRIGHTVGK